jgi:hypothetical protein
MQHCCELVLPIGLTSPLDFTKDYNVVRKQSRNRVESGSSSVHSILMKSKTNYSENVQLMHACYTTIHFNQEMKGKEAIKL